MKIRFSGGDAAVLAAGWTRALSIPGTRVAGPAPTPATAASLAEVGIDLANPWDPIEVADLAVGVGAPAGEGTETLRWPEDGGEPAALRAAVRERVEALLAARSRRVAYGDAVKERFALRSDVLFLNHGSFGATPREVLAAQREIQDQMEAQPVDFMVRALPGRMRAAAARVAPVLKVDPDDLVFVENATTGVNAVVRSIDWKPGDRIVTTDHVYGAVRATLEWVAARTGAVVVPVEVPFPLSDPAQVVAAVSAVLPGARLAVLDHLTSSTGLVFPIRELVAACRAHGVQVLVDGAHAPGQVVLDLDALGADWWVGNAHKWLFAPKGCALLHVRRDHHATTFPTTLSHGTFQGLIPAFDWVGTRDPSAWLAIDASLKFVESLGGLDRIRAHDVLLRREGARRVLDTLGGRPPAPESMLAALQTLPLPDTLALPGTQEHAWALNRTLWERHRIEATFAAFAGRVWLRLSCQVYHRPDDFTRLAQVLADLADERR